MKENLMALLAACSFPLIMWVLFLIADASADERPCEDIVRSLYLAEESGNDAAANQARGQIMDCMADDIKRGTDDYRAAMGWKPSP